MFQDKVEARIFYRHSWEETAELAKAIIPLGQAIKAVGTVGDRQTMRLILDCGDFRKKDAVRMKNMLCRATKYTRAHVGDCLEFIREAELGAAERLEEALARYWAAFLHAEVDIIPVN